jgi:hypothetical protein
MIEQNFNWQSALFKSKVDGEIHLRGSVSDERTLRSKDIMKVFHLISRPTL